MRDELKAKAFEAFASREKFQHFVNPNLRKDGTVAILETSGAPILDDHGKLLGYRGVDRDMTERRRMQEAQKMLYTAVDQAADAVIVTDSDGDIAYVNPAFSLITGYSREEVIGKNPRILKSGVHQESFYNDLWATITRGKIWRARLTNRCKDDSVIVCESTIAPVKNEKGHITHYVCVNRDITQAELMQERLIQSQKMEAIGTLAGGIAHDFNNILFAMTGYTELAMENLPLDSEIYSDLERVLEAGKRAADMVKQILTFSRQAHPETRLIDLSPIVKEGLKFLRASIPSTIEIRQNIRPSIGKVHGDPTQIHQVLMNFCTNAVHAMRDTKGVLAVELIGVEIDKEYASTSPELCSGKYVRLTVGDTGHGIPAEMLDRIFEPYFTTKKAGEGTGLGLSVVHGIVKTHGGAITVYSEIDKGSTFHIYFPVIEDEPGTEEDSSISDVTPTGSERVLLVDDEPLLVEMGQTILERLGYQVQAHTSAVEALEQFRGDPDQFDLVITDLTMPKMTGDELALELKKIRPEIPVILCTGFSESLGEDRQAETGIDSLISKPILKKHIARVIREVLRPRE